MPTRKRYVLILEVDADRPPPGDTVSRVAEHSTAAEAFGLGLDGASCRLFRPAAGESLLRCAAEILQALAEEPAGELRLHLRGIQREAAGTRELLLELLTPREVGQ
jgi:hypothetical protein